MAENSDRNLYLGALDHVTCQVRMGLGRCDWSAQYRHSGFKGRAWIHVFSCARGHRFGLRDERPIGMSREPLPDEAFGRERGREDAGSGESAVGREAMAAYAEGREPLEGRVGYVGHLIVVPMSAAPPVFGEPR